MSCKPHPPLSPRLIGYDPVVDLAQDHLARFVDEVVDSSIPAPVKSGAGQPPYDVRMTMKVLLYGYATGVRSSRRLAKNCCESLPFLLLVRDDRPSYRTLCTARVDCREQMETTWLSLLRTASECGMGYLGKIAIDTTRLRADASGESVVSRKRMEEVLTQFREILREAHATDAKEDEEGLSLHTETGVPVAKMREVLRRIKKKDAEKIVPSPGLCKQIEKGIVSLESGMKENVSHVSLSDPDSRMMQIGSRRKVHLGYGFEAAADNGILVVGQAHDSPTDNERLATLLEESRKVDPVPITQVSADSGFYSGGIINTLLQDPGLTVVVPDSNTAASMRKTTEPPADPIVFTKLEDRNVYMCPQGKLLKPEDRTVRAGQKITTYVVQTSCLDCPLASKCLKSPTAKRRNLHVGEFHATLRPHLDRFSSEEMRLLYYARGPAIETVFSFIRQILLFKRWSLRGLEKVRTEASILKNAYQLRKIHIARATA